MNIAKNCNTVVLSELSEALLTVLLYETIGVSIKCSMLLLMDAIFKSKGKESMLILLFSN